MELLYQAVMAGVSQLSPSTFLFVIIGVTVGQVVAVIPGLGGIFGVAILLPFTFTLSPTEGIALVIGVAVTSGTGNTITAVLFGIPGSPTGIASVFDGYPLAKQGQAARAIAAGVTASMVGGVFGALVLAILMPFARPLTLALGPSEFFTLILAALVFMAFIRSDDAAKAMLSAGIGLMLSLVGQELSTATVRYAFGQLYLWDGIRLVPFMIGLFAISEMLALHQSGLPIASRTSSARGTGALRGIRDVFTYWRTTLQSSAIGVGIGLVPGLGGETAQFLAYSRAGAVQDKHQFGDAAFGQGSIRGVIAADAATNSKDGGALIPTLAFGIPGSASMALLLVAFTQMGITPGPDILIKRPEVIWYLVLLLILANVYSTALCLAAAPLLARLTRVSPALIVPAVLIVSLVGSYASSGHLGDVITALAAGFIGYFMKKHNYSSVLLIIGLVLGKSLEQNYLLATRLFGWQLLLRPATLTILALLVLALVLSPIKRWMRKRD